MKIFTFLSALISFIFCLLGGLIILKTVMGSGLLNPENALPAGIGFYFVGKAVYVGNTIISIAKEKKSNP